jgi:hypothetical protein
VCHNRAQRYFFEAKAERPKVKGDIGVIVWPKPMGNEKNEQKAFGFKLLPLSLKHLHLINEETLPVCFIIYPA